MHPFGAIERDRYMIGNLDNGGQVQDDDEVSDVSHCSTFRVV